MAKRARFRHDQLVRLPENSTISLRQWAAFSLRYITAYSNWWSAAQTWRVQMEDSYPDECHVVGWGGGVSHYAPCKHGLEAVHWANTTGWAPDVAETSFSWTDIDKLASAYIDGDIQDYFPIFEINAP